MPYQMSADDEAMRKLQALQDDEDNTDEPATVDPTTEDVTDEDVPAEKPYNYDTFRAADFPGKTLMNPNGIPQDPSDVIGGDKATPVPDFAKSSTKAMSLAPAEPAPEAPLDYQAAASARYKQIEDKLKELQELRSSQQSKNNMLGAADKVAQGIARMGGGTIDSDAEGIKRVSDQANQPIKDYEAILKNYKTMLGMTPYQQQWLELRKRGLDQGDQRIGMQSDVIDWRKDEATSKLARAFNDAINVDKLSKNTNAGRAAYSLGAARQLELVVNSKPKGDYTNVEMEEIANMANRMFTGGSSQSRTAVDSLVQSTGAKSFSNLITYVTNNPQSVEAKDFVDVFKHQADREKVYATNILNKYIGSQAPAYYRLLERNPKAYNEILQGKFDSMDSQNSASTQSTDQLANDTKRDITKTMKTKMVRVKSKISGKTGSIPASDYDAHSDKYELINE